MLGACLLAEGGRFGTARRVRRRTPASRSPGANVQLCAGLLTPHAARPAGLHTPGADATRLARSLAFPPQTTLPFCQNREQFGKLLGEPNLLNYKELQRERHYFAAPTRSWK